MRPLPWLLPLTLMAVAMAQSTPPAAAGDAATEADGYYQRGLQYARSNQDDKAAADFRKAIELDPKRFEPYQGLDDVLSRHGDWDTIIASWTRFIELQPNVARAYCERGGAYSHKHDLAHMVADADRACNMGYDRCCQIMAHLAKGAPMPDSGGRAERPAVTAPSTTDQSHQPSRRPPQPLVPAQDIVNGPKKSLLPAWDVQPWWVVMAALGLWALSSGRVKLRRETPLPFDPSALSGWKAPPELQVPLPRQVEASKRSRRERIVGFVFALAAFFFWIGMGASVTAELLVRGKELWGGAAVVFFVAVGIVVFRMPFQVGKSDQRLLIWGTPTAALITKVNRGPTPLVRFSFLDQSGRPRGGFDRVANVSPGDVVTVLYDPEKPSHYLRYPLGDYWVCGPENQEWLQTQ